MRLNEFHRKIKERNAEVFASNRHTAETAYLALLSELGETANAVVGWHGCEERKAALGVADVLDGVGDSIVYLSILADKLGLRLEEFEHVTIEEMRGMPVEVAVARASHHVACIGLQVARREPVRQASINRALVGLLTVAVSAGLSKWKELEALLVQVFNHVSERSGSKIRMEP